MPDAQKKAILRRLDGETLFGYLPITGFVDAGACHYLDLDGRANSIPLQQLKSIFFVRDFNRADPVNPERLSRRTFLGRPRGEGLWVRLTLQTDGELLEGLAATDLGLLTTLLADNGLHLTPPDIRSNTLRVFVPHHAMLTMELLGVVGTRSPRTPVPAGRPAQPATSDQESLFPPDPTPPVRPAGRGTRP